LQDPLFPPSRRLPSSRRFKGQEETFPFALAAHCDCIVRAPRNTLGMDKNLDLSTEFRMEIAHHKEIQNVTFRALALRQSKIKGWWIECGLYVEW